MKGTTMKFDKKHRPKSLADVVYADAAVEQALNDYANNQRDKHLLLYGPKGTGKSVSAQLVLNQRMAILGQTGLNDIWNAKAYQAAHDTFDPVMTQWNWQLSMGANSGCSVFDEIDQFTLPMQQKLRAFIDQFEMGMVIATTNDLHLVDGPLKDRFRPLFVEYPNVQQWVPRVVAVLGREGIPITPSQATGLLQGFEGSGRTLDDWMEDYVLRLKRMMTQLTTRPSASQPSSQSVNNLEAE
jgi:replication-associated recombination protein RarA